MSKEGVTQGDNTAMAMYAIGVRPLINELSNISKSDEFCQVWFADDSSGGGNLSQVRQWWDEMKEKGPKYGYFPKASKTHLILKKEEDLEKATQLFEGEGIKITMEGQRHIGAAIGKVSFKEEFVGEKVGKWCKDIEKLANFAKEEPQAALSAFNIGMSRRWTYTQRTIEDTSKSFEPLEKIIRDKLIPALVGRTVSTIERSIIALPYRYGGLGIQDPTEVSNTEYQRSKQITEQLTEMIIRQDMDVTKLDNEDTKKKKREMKKQREIALKNKMLQIKEKLNEKDKKILEGAQEKGASAWLSSLPIKSLGY